MTAVLMTKNDICHFASMYNCYVVFRHCVCVCAYLKCKKNVEVWQKSACNCDPVITATFDKMNFSSKLC